MSDIVTDHQPCWDRIEQLAYLAAGLRREHHPSCGQSPNIVCMRCVAIDEYELDRIDRAAVRNIIAAQQRGNAAFHVDAEEAAERLREAIRQHPSSQPGIEAVVDDILRPYRFKTGEHGA